MAKRISDEIKKEVLRRAANGEKVDDLSKEFDFHPTSFSKWKRAFGAVRAKKKIMTKKSAPRRNVFQEKVKRLENEAEFWKNKYTELLYERNE